MNERSRRRRPYDAVGIGLEGWGALPLLPFGRTGTVRSPVAGCGVPFGRVEPNGTTAAARSFPHDGGTNYF